MATFFWGLFIVTTGKGTMIEKSYSYAFILVHFFLEFNIMTIGNVSLFLTMIQKINQSAAALNAMDMQPERH
jgi:hypothetical protein